MWLSRLLDWYEKLALALGGVLLVVMCILMNTEIATRYLLRFSIQISDEYSSYIFAWISAICFVPALRQGRFLQVQSVLRTLPLSAQAVLEIVAALIGAVLSGVLAYECYVLAATSFRFGSQSIQYSATPLFIPQAVMPVCFGVLAIAYLEQGVFRAARLWSGQPVEVTAHVLD